MWVRWLYQLMHGLLLEGGLICKEYRHQLDVAIRRDIYMPFLFLVMRLFENHRGFPHILVFILADIVNYIIRENAIQETSNSYDQDLSNSFDHLRSVNAMFR